MRYRLIIGAIGLGAAVSLTAGCRSAVSSHVTPDPLEGGWNVKKVRGMPVTVRLPKSLEIKVVERRFYQPGGDFARIEGATARIVRQEVLHKDQVFMVDAVRPAAGDLTFGASFENEASKNNPDANRQFFASYDSKVDDKTIKTITSLVPGLPDVLANIKKARAIAGDGVTNDAKVAMAYTEHLVAVKVFDVYDPCLTEQVMQFMDEYVNNCKPTCSAPSCVIK